MLWFKKKDKQEDKNNEGDDSASEEDAAPKSAISGNVEVELTKIKTQIDAFNEVRKANAEQFTRISEQIGELRGALMDSNKAISVIEVASTKAIDSVNSVQPDKLMIEVRRTDGKVEALRASIEANETMMKDILKELKEMRELMNLYKGLDQVVKLNNEIKQELIDIKKTEGTVGKHADRVETIFVEVEKKFYDFDKFNDVVKELDKTFKKLSSDFDKIRVGVEEKADKKEFVKLGDKFADFEKHTTNIMKLLDQKGRNTVDELNVLFEQLKRQLEKKYDVQFNVKHLTSDSVTGEKPTNAEKAAENPAGKPTENPAGNPADNTASGASKAQSDVESSKGDNAAADKSEKGQDGKSQDVDNKTKDAKGPGLFGKMFRKPEEKKA